jgi:SAM-dependent methyltransferase
VSKARSYSSKPLGLTRSFRELERLYRIYSLNVPRNVEERIKDVRRAESLINEQLGVELRDLDILEIGPGQFLSQMIYFGRQNRVVGIDLDVIVQGFDPIGYARMIRHNGVKRIAKTVFRKVLGIDARNKAELKRQLQLPSVPKMRVHRMDACKLEFADSSFDCAYSRSVFHHLPRPQAAIDEIVRVLRRGGCAYVSFHLYTSQTGSLDPNVLVQREDEIGAWPHLRERFRNSVRSTSYLNQLRLEEWRQLFTERMPGVEFIYNRAAAAANSERLERAAIKLQSRGELLEYSLDELLTFEVIAFWKKADGQ